VPRFKKIPRSASLEIEPKDKEQSHIYLVFNADKSQQATAAASPRSTANASSSTAAPASGGLQRAQSVIVKAGTGPITPDRELSVAISIWQDSGTVYVTVNATNSALNINVEGKTSFAENYWPSVTMKELKRKFPTLPPTSDRGVINAVSGSKNIKDTDKLAAQGVKGKKGDTLKFSLVWELAASGNASAASAAATAAIVTTGEPAPDIDAKQAFNVDFAISLLEGNIFIKLTCTSEVVPEIHKSAALPKVTFSVFSVKDVIGLLKGPQYPILEKWAIFDTGSGKIKVSEATALSKLGVTFVTGKTNNFKFIFIIDKNAPLPTGDK